MDEETGMCFVCGDEASVYIDSLFTDDKVALCDECIICRREPYATMLSGLAGVEKEEDIAPWALLYVESTLKFYGKTMEEFVNDCQRYNAEVG